MSWVWLGGGHVWRVAGALWRVSLPPCRDGGPRRWHVGYDASCSEATWETQSGQLCLACLGGGCGNPQPSDQVRGGLPACPTVVGEIVRRGANHLPWGESCRGPKVVGSGWEWLVWCVAGTRQLVCLLSLGDRLCRSLM